MYSNDELKKKSGELYKQANEIVSNLNLLQIANKYSRCYQIGSSIMNLMVDEDIDFVCYEKNPVSIENCLKFAEELIKIPSVDTLRIKNYLNKDPYFQFKVYIDPYVCCGKNWKIAFSFQVYSDDLYKKEVEKIDWVKNNIDEAKKLTILRLKQQTRDMGMKIPGAKIYDAVILKNISDYKLL